MSILKLLKVGKMLTNYLTFEIFKAEISSLVYFIQQFLLHVGLDEISVKLMLLITLRGLELLRGFCTLGNFYAKKNLKLKIKKVIISVVAEVETRKWRRMFELEAKFVKNYL